MADKHRYARDEIEFARALTFFDAVFAFALTLLITTVDDFSPTAWTSLSAFWAANGSSLTSFTISFFVVVQFWRASHRELAGYRHLDNGLITMHTTALLGVVLIPFTTEAMGKPGLRDLPLPTALYALNVAGAYLLYVAASISADRRGLRANRRTPTQWRETVASAVVVAGVFLASIPVAYLVGPSAAQLSWILLIVLGPGASRLAAGSGGSSSR